MGRRGKQGGSKMRMVEPIMRQRPSPQIGMSPKARTIWLRIVKSFPPEHFKPYQYDLLRNYCEAANSFKTAMYRIHKEGEVVTQENGIVKENPWVGVAIKMSAQMVSLSTKLGLNINATLVNRGKAGNATEPKSKRDGLLFGGQKR